MTSTVPRIFDDHAASETPEGLVRKWGAREPEFRGVGARCMEKEREERLAEAANARDGRMRRQAAEEVRRGHCHAASGEPWRSARYGGRRSTPRHLAGGRYTGAACGGLFSEVPLLEATESAARRRVAFATQRREVEEQRRSNFNAVRRR